MKTVEQLKRRKNKKWWSDKEKQKLSQHTWNRLLVWRKNGPRPHTANIIIQTGGTNLITEGGQPPNTLQNLRYMIKCEKPAELKYNQFQSSSSWRNYMNDLIDTSHMDILPQWKYH